MTQERHLILAGLHNLLAKFHLELAGVRPLTRSEMETADLIHEWWTKRQEG